MASVGWGSSLSSVSTHLCELAPATSLALRTSTCPLGPFVSEPGAVCIPMSSKPLSMLTLSLVPVGASTRHPFTHHQQCIHPLLTHLSAIHSPVHQSSILPSFIPHTSVHSSTMHLTIHFIHPSSIQFIHPSIHHPSHHPSSLFIHHPSTHPSIHHPFIYPSTHPFTCAPDPSFSEVLLGVRPCGP